MSNYISPNDLRQVHDDFTFPAEVHTVIECAADTIGALEEFMAEHEDRILRGVRSLEQLLVNAEATADVQAIARLRAKREGMKIVLDWFVSRREEIYR